MYCATQMKLVDWLTTYGVQCERYGAIVRHIDPRVIDLSKPTREIRRVRTRLAEQVVQSCLKKAGLLRRLLCLPSKLTDSDASSRSIALTDLLNSYVTQITSIVGRVT